jgi:hypothetical protein
MTDQNAGRWFVIGAVAIAIASFVRVTVQAVAFYYE